MLDVMAEVLGHVFWPQSVGSSFRHQGQGDRQRLVIDCLSALSCLVCRVCRAFRLQDVLTRGHVGVYKKQGTLNIDPQIVGPSGMFPLILTVPPVIIPLKDC